MACKSPKRQGIHKHLIVVSQSQKKIHVSDDISEWYVQGYTKSKTYEWSISIVISEDNLKASIAYRLSYKSSEKLLGYTLSYHTVYISPFQVNL